MYVAIYYAKLEDSPYIDGKLLQKTVVRFTVAAPSNLVQEAMRVRDEDVARTDTPLMVFNASWGSRWGFTLWASVMGGVPPYEWSAECGSVSFSKDMAKSEGDEVFFQTLRAPEFIQEPVPCVMTVTDSAGNVDHGHFAVPTIQSPEVGPYCFERAPWVDRETTTDNRCGGKKLPITPTEVAAGGK